MEQLDVFVSVVELFHEGFGDQEALLELFSSQAVQVAEQRSFDVEAGGGRLVEVGAGGCHHVAGGRVAGTGGIHVDLGGFEGSRRDATRHTVQLRLALTSGYFLCGHLIVFLDDDVVSDLVELDKCLLDEDLLVVSGRADLAELIELQLLSLSRIEFRLVEGV